MNWMNRQFIIGMIILSSFGGCVKHAFATTMSPYENISTTDLVAELKMRGYQSEPMPQSKIDAPKGIRCTDQQFDEIDGICSEVSDDDQIPKCIQDAIKLKCTTI